MEVKSRLLANRRKPLAARKLAMSTFVNGRVVTPTESR